MRSAERARMAAGSSPSRSIAPSWQERAGGAAGSRLLGLVAGLLLALLFALAWQPVARAGEAAPASADPVLEARVMKLAAELRCLVCQNQTIAESHADLAVDLRNQVRDMLRAGRSEAEIKAFMTDRYGDFVLYRPPLKSSTALLWFGPALLMAIGLAVLLTVLHRRRRLDPDRFEPDPEPDPDEAPRAPGPSPAAARPDSHA